ncbi:Ig-like domain-containing protein [Aeromicrobium sp. NPDC092404]|uniref:Ig-like domain-containing protein n=1 Tax=Aeromicrobium sp. NPDC092404 TaxID=3154976 RepID=UPI0034157518
MNSSQSPLRRLGAGTAIGALVASSLLLTSPAQAADKVITPNLVDQGNTRATGHNDFLEDGVHVWTEGNSNTGPRTDGGAGNWNTDKAAGYFDVEVDLNDATDAAMSWRNTAATPTARPGTQLVVDIDGDGDRDGILVGEPVYGDDWWLSEGSAEAKAVAPVVGGGSGSEWHGTLEQWAGAAAASAEVIELGWSLGSGVHGDGVIESMTLGGDTYYFSNGLTTNVLYAADVDTTSTRSAGHNTFRPTGGVRTWTDNDSSEAKAAGLFDVDLPLDQAGEPTIDYRTNSGTIPPGLWLTIDADDDGDVDGTLISEASYYGNDWWLNETSGVMYDNAPSQEGGSGSDRHGTLSGWLQEFPEAQIVQAGWSLGSGVEGDYIVDAITVGLTKYTFTGQNVDPTAETVTGSVQAGKTVTLTLQGADRNEDDLTYSITDDGAGTATVDGDDLTFTAANNFHGVTTLTYEVSDGHGGTATGQVKINIGKASSATTFTLKPSAPTSATTPAVDITVTSTGYMKGGKVDVYVDQKLVNSGTTYSTGKALLSLKKKLTKGTHSVSVYYRGTSYTLPSFKGMKVTITR